MKTINEEYLDSVIRRTVKLERYQEGMRQDVLTLLNEVETSIVRDITGIDPAAPKLTKWKRKRLMKLYANVSSILNDGYTKIARFSKSQLKQLAVQEGDLVANTVNSLVGVDLFDVTLDPARLSSLVDNTMIDGRLIGDWWMDQKEGFRKTFQGGMEQTMEQIQLGTVRGESVGELIRRVKGSTELPGMMKNVRRESEALVRTSVMSVANKSRTEMYKANRDVMEGFEVVATLDTATTPICRALDGKQWDWDYNPIGHTIPYPLGPPFHWNCFVDPQVPIYTSKGWKPIGKIKVGDRVLTHKGRYRKVTELIRTPKQMPTVTKLGISGKEGYQRITVTDGHPLMVNGKWKNAGDVQSGDKASFLSHKCKRTECKNSVPSGLYEFTEFEVKVIERWALKKPRMLYNFSVREDESYIARGFVAHNCRTTTVPVLKSWASLAGPKSKLSKSKLRKLDKVDNKVRASMTYPGKGKPVSGRMTYNEWLKKQSTDTQIEALGASRQKLWKERNLSMKDMVNQRGRQLTLAELEERT